MGTERPRLEVLSWVAGILSAAIAAYAYFRPPSSAAETTPIQLMAPTAVVAHVDSVPTPVPPTSPIAPSFDCAKATWKSERIVCSSPQLAVLDLSMSNAYRDAVARTPSRATEFRISQNRWLRKDRESCGDIPCLQRIYQVRIRELGSM